MSTNTPVFTEHHGGLNRAGARHPLAERTGYWFNNKRTAAGCRKLYSVNAKHGLT